MSPKHYTHFTQNSVFSIVPTLPIKHLLYTIMYVNRYSLHITTNMCKLFILEQLNVHPKMNTQKTAWHFWALPFLLGFVWWNPIIYLHEDFAHIRSMMSWCHPLFGPHSFSMNPSEARTTAGGPKNRLRSPPSVATIGAAARRLGKVWQLKSIHGSVKHQPCVPCFTHQWEVGAEKGKGIRLGCKLAKTLAMTLGDVWLKTEKKSPF